MSRSAAECARRGDAYFFGHGVARNPTEAAKWYGMAAEQGDAYGQNGLGMCYENGTGVARDLAEAKRLYFLAAEQGNAAGQNNLGRCYENGLGGSQDLDRAVEQYEYAAGHGDASGHNNLGRCYENGIGVPKDLERAAKQYGYAVKQYEYAANQGDASGHNNLGRCYENGIGVPKDLERAAKQYEYAAERGDAFGHNNLGRCYENGIGVPKDLERAAKQYEYAADRGDASGHNNLGRCFENGIGVPKDLGKAAEQYRIAADQGIANGQNNFGRCYENGCGVEKNFEKAAELYLFAADQDHAEGLRNLGRCYENGLGIAINMLKALDLYRKAATMGHRHVERDIKRVEAVLAAVAAHPDPKPSLWVEVSDVTYDCSKCLGNGGFGTVYCGKYRQLKDVAVKVYLERYNTEEANRLLETEVKIWSELPGHDNVVALLGYRTSPTFLITKLYSRGSMKEFLAAKDWDPALALHLLAEAAIGIDFLHSKGVIHSDLKADNVLVEEVVEEGRPTPVAKIADFGLAKKRTRVEDAGGNPVYEYQGKGGASLRFAPPEYFRSLPLHRQSDVWSFGMMCYQVFSKGYPPYLQCELEKVGVAVCDGKLPDRPYGVPDAVWDLMKSCWKQNIDERPTMAEIARDLIRIKNEGFPSADSSTGKTSGQPSSDSVETFRT